MNLQCELDNRPLSIDTAGRSIVVDLPDMATGLKILKLGSPRGTYRDATHRVHQWLEATSMTLDVRLDGKSLCAIGGNRGNSFWRVLGLPPLYLRPVELLRQYIHERRNS